MCSLSRSTGCSLRRIADTPTPTASSGGLQTLFLTANYMVPGREKGGAVVKHEDMEAILPFLVENWKSQPLQDKQSPDFFNTYVNYSGSIILGCSSESLYLGWYNGFPITVRRLMAI